jgi:hypothetical protein
VSVKPTWVAFPRRYKGLLRCGHGGYFAGLLFDRVGESNVALLEPVPTEVLLAGEFDSRRDRVYPGEDLIATAAHQAPLVVDLPPVRVSVAKAAKEQFPRSDPHPVASCFVCGIDPERPPSLGTTPGPIGLDGVLTCIWAPDPTAGLLGRPSGPSGGLRSSGLPRRVDPRPVVRSIVVLTFAAHVADARAGERHVFVAAAERHHGRIAVMHTSLYGRDGRWMAARATWLAVEPHRSGEGARHQ